MKYLIIADNHLCTKSSVINGRGEDFSDRLENQIKSFEWVSSFGLPVIHLGDFFQNSWLSAEEISAFEKIKPFIKKDWLFLLGNHEYSGDYDTLGILNSQCIRKAQEVDFSGLRALFLPFNSTEEDIKGHYDIIFGHIGIKDIPFGARGFDFDIIDESCDIFLNGHLHNRLELGKNKWNIGSLTAQNFSDDDLEWRKGAVILDTETKSLEFVENPYAFNFYKFSWNTYLTNYKGTELEEAIRRPTSCISMACKNGQKKDILTAGDFENVYYLRISEELPEKESSVEEDEGPVSLDHIGKFRDSFIKKYGDNPIILEELTEVLK